MALGDLAGVLIVALLIVLALSVHPSAIFKPDGGDYSDSGKTGKTTSEDKNQQTDKEPSPSLPSSVIAPKPASQPTPGTVLNLANWKLTLPVDTAHAGIPDEISQPELATFILSPYFQLNPARSGVVFRANVDGATTIGSQYPRSELREMTNGGKQPASWSSTSGTHTMTIRQVITHTPSVKPDVVAGQIHDASDDVVMVRLKNRHLFIEADGKDIGALDDNYSLGGVFTVQLVATDGHIKALYNGIQKVDYLKSGSGYYFKAGCYTQSNTSKGDSSGEYGEVVIYNLQVSHS
ncbi:polysaccharide lyase family 7 protein [Candidatus Saccharibacteria bacterium]|nr:polysaccharide lyase family 7 protein [Candidatus Saccharibacteria bacterium]